MYVEIGPSKGMGDGLADDVFAGNDPGRVKTLKASRSRAGAMTTAADAGRRSLSLRRNAACHRETAS